jgi:hypothetical protein
VRGQESKITRENAVCDQREQADCLDKDVPNPLRSSVHTLAGSGSARYNVLRLFVSPEFDFAEGSLFKPLVGLESKINRSKKQTINTLFLKFV